MRYALDVVVVVLNDGAYGAEHIQFRQRQMDPAISLMDWPALGPVAVALGGEGHTVHTLEELDQVLAKLPARSGPTLLDIRLDPEQVPGGGH